MAVMTSEMIAARALLKGINTLDFNVEAFASIFSRNSSAVQRRLFNMFIGMCRYYESMYRNGAVDETDGKFYDMCVYAARILDIVPDRV